MKKTTQDSWHLGFLKYAVVVAVLVGGTVFFQPARAGAHDWTDGIYTCSIEVTETGTLVSLLAMGALEGAECEHKIIPLSREECRISLFGKENGPESEFGS